MFNLIGRFFRVMLQILTVGMIRFEKGTASQRREAIIDEKIRQVAEARQSLGRLNGAGRTQARRVKQLEEQVAQIQARKTHFLNQLKAAAEGSQAALEAERAARHQHLQLKELNNDLNRERAGLQQITKEYEAAKALVRTAERSVAEAKRQGDRLAQRRESAKRRNELLETTAELQGLGGVANELADMDRLMQEEIDQLEGAAFAQAEHMADQMSERNLDIRIAQSQAEDEFEAELRSMRSTPVDVTASPTKALASGGQDRALEVASGRESEPASQSSLGGGDFGSSD